MLQLPNQISCGYFDCSEFGELTTSPKRSVTRYEIEFYLEDGKTTTVDDRTFPIFKDYIQIAKPGQVRHSQLPFKTAYLKFDASGELARLLDAAPEYFRSSHPDRIVLKVDELILLREEENSLLFYSRFLSLLNLLLYDAKIPFARSGKNYEIIASAKRYIEQHFSEPITLLDMADSVHLSKIYFQNIFKESVGITPHQYLINCRIENAKKLLWNTNIPMSEVAEKSGFGCQQYLNKVFKRETRMTPLSYRRTLQKNYSL